MDFEIVNQQRGADEDQDNVDIVRMEQVPVEQALNLEDMPELELDDDKDSVDGKEEKEPPRHWYRRCTREQHRERNECSICRDPVYRSGCEVIVCSHRFHIPCILRWSEEHNTCPLCRAELRANWASRVARVEGLDRPLSPAELRNMAREAQPDMADIFYDVAREIEDQRARALEAARDPPLPPVDPQVRAEQSRRRRERRAQLRIQAQINEGLRQAAQERRVDNPRADVVDHKTEFKSQLEDEHLLFELNGVPEGASWVIHPYAIESGLTRDYNIVTVGNRHHIQGFVTFRLYREVGGGVENVRVTVNRFVETWDLDTPVFWSLNDYIGVSLVPGPVGEAPPEFALVPGFHHGSNEERLRNSFESVMPQLSLDTQIDREQMVNLIRNHYRRFWKEYPGLLNDIYRFLSSPFATDRVMRHNQSIIDGFNANADALLLKHYAWKGATKSDYSFMLAKRVGWVYVRRGVAAFYVLACLAALCLLFQSHGKVLSYVVAQVAWVAPELLNVYLMLMIVGAGVTFLTRAVKPILLGPLFRTSAARVARSEMVEEIRPKHVMAWTPCSKIKLMKSSIMDTPHRLMPDQYPGVVHEVKEDLRQMPTRTSVDIYGTAMDVPVVYPESCPQNLEAAVKVRMGFDRLIDDSLGAEFLGFAKQFIDEEIPVLTFDFNRDAIKKHLIATYGQAKGERLFQLYDEPLEHKDAESEIFPKKEPYLGKDIDNVKYRQIWNRSEKIIARFSYAFAQIGKLFKTLFPKGSSSYYVSGDQPVGVGSHFGFMLRKFMCTFESDVSNWDGSMNHWFLAVEKYLMTTKFSDPHFDFLLEHWDVVTGRSKDRTYKVKLPFGRRSGDLWTSTFNSLLNICVTRFALHKLGFTKDEVAVMVLGDDNVFWTTRPFEVGAYVDIYAKLGLKNEVEQRTDPELVTFCSGRFWRVHDTYVWGSMAFRPLCKFGWNHNNLPEKMYGALIYGNAMSMLGSAGHVPVLGAFYRTIAADGVIRKLRPRKDPSDRNPYKIEGGPVLYPTWETRLQYEKIYGIAPDLQLLLERQIQQGFRIASFPCFINDNLFTRGAKIDLGYSDDIVPAEYLLTPTGDPEYMEEMNKLQGAGTLEQALTNAAEFAVEEEEILASQGKIPKVSHVLLHKLFTFFSWHHLPAGVFVHKAYNNFVFRMGWPEANKRKAKQKPKKPQKKLKKQVKTVKKEVSTLAKALKGVGGVAGGMLAGPPGAQLGSMAGGWLAKLIGNGDYKVNSNTLAGGGVPSFNPEKHGTRICHREFIGNVGTSTSFELQNVLTLNPGDPITFPWLSLVASHYEEYKFNGLVFAYNPTSSTALNSVNPAQGVVIMATQYNVARANFLSKIEMESYEFSCSGAPYTPLLHPIECKPSLGVLERLFVSSNSASDGNDPRFVDFGRFSLATEGMQSEYVCGELWVTYDVTLYKPRIDPLIDTPIQFARYDSVGDFSAGSFQGGTFELLLTPDDDLDWVVSGTLPAGYYLIILQALNTGGSVGGAFSAFTSDGWASPNPTADWFVGGGFYWDYINSSSSTMMRALVSDGTPGRLTFQSPIWTGGTITAGEILVFAVPDFRRIFSVPTVDSLKRELDDMRMHFLRLQTSEDEEKLERKYISKKR